MIVLPHEGKWHIIFQRAHAQLAATIASHVAPDYLPGDISFSDLHTAIADHDDGRQKWKGRYHITKQGKPMDYNEQPLPMKLNQATKSVEKARYKSPWIGLLISMHHTSLYWPYKDKNEKIAAYIGAQKVVQEKLKRC